MSVDRGQITAESGSDGKDVVRAELNAGDQQWHYVTVTRTGQHLRLDIDDLYASEIDRVSPDSQTLSEAIIRFGSANERAFIGCIGDVTFNGVLLNFANVRNICSGRNVLLGGDERCRSNRVLVG